MRLPSRQVADPQAQQNFEAIELVLPKLVTALPSKVADGQEVYYVASATSGVVWHLRYRAASTSPYKWEFVGGSSLQSTVLTGESSASNAYVALTTAGPSVTVPLAGDYEVTIGAAGNAPAAADAIMSYDVGAAAAVDTERCLIGAAPGYSQGASRTMTKLAIAANTALVAKYRTAAATSVTYFDRFMRVTPIRVG